MSPSDDAGGFFSSIAETLSDAWHDALSTGLIGGFLAIGISTFLFFWGAQTVRLFFGVLCSIYQWLKNPCLRAYTADGQPIYIAIGPSIVVEPSAPLTPSFLGGGKKSK